MLEDFRDFAHSWGSKAFLAVIALSFALWGVSSYFSKPPGEGVVAHVGSTEIRSQDLLPLLQQAQGQRPDVPRETLAGLILEQVLREALFIEAAKEAGIFPDDESVLAAIKSIPAFQESGKLSRKRYEEVLRASRISPARFEEKIGEGIIANAFLSPFKTVFLPSWLVEDAAAILGEKRVVRLARLVMEPDKETVTEEEARHYHEAHALDFSVPERIRLRYVRLRQEDLKNTIAPSEKEIEAYFEAHAEAFSQKEARLISHIFISRAKDPDGKRIGEILGQAQANPLAFAELAQGHSEDLGSARQGGLLGWVEKDALPPSLAEAVFAAAKGEVVGPVEGEGGRHVFFVQDIRPQRRMALAEARDQAIEAIRREKAQRLFEEKSRTLMTLAEEHAQPLDEAAKSLGLPLEETPWITRQGGGTFSDPGLLEEAFDPRAIAGKKTLSPRRLGEGDLILAQVVSHEEPRGLSFDEARGLVKEKLLREKAARTLEQRGKAFLQNPEGAPFGQETVMGRGGSDADLPPEVLASIFFAPGPFPKVIGKSASSAYWVVEIKRAIAGEKNGNTLAQARVFLQGLYLQAGPQALAMALEARFPPKVNEKALASLASRK